MRESLFSYLTPGILLSLLLLFTVLPRPSLAVEDGKLLIWINGDKAYSALQGIGDRFEDELGIPVQVEHPESPTDKFAPAARAGKGPDIFIWAHDRLGEWADSGLLTPLHIDPGYKERFFPKAWKGFTHKGRIWGYPIAMEVVALVYNESILDQPPGSLEDVFSISPDLQRRDIDPILWAYKNPYFTWGIIAGAGGYTFGQQPNGDYNPDDIGVNTPGAVAALETIHRMVTDAVMPKGVTYSVMDSRMNAGECAMMINGPWSWSNLEKSGIDFGVATIPSLEGKPGKPFIGVLGAMIDRNSPNKDLAEEFLVNYVLTTNGLRSMDQDVPIGVPALKAFYDELSADPHIRGSMDNVEVGVLMPNIPQMGRFWSAMESALSNVMDGQASPRDALDNAEIRIRKGN